MTQSTTFQLFDFVVYTDLDVDLKGVTPYKTLKEKLNNKYHYDDNYSASIYAMHALFALNTYLATLPWGSYTVRFASSSPP